MQTPRTRPDDPAVPNPIRKANMGLFDSLRPKKDDEEKERPRADFSGVQSGSSSTAPEGTTAPAGAGRTYTVKKGDTLSDIAQEAYGDASKWRAIYEANRDKIADPDLIHPGEVFVLPPNA